MITFEDISKKFDGKTISSIESIAKSHDIKSAYNRKEFILTLYYLERTNRYKETTAYKNETFKQYISDKYKLSYPTYNKERFASLPPRKRLKNTESV